MPLTAEERQALRRYLLGEELGQEQVRIEEAYFSNDAYFREFLDVERELMEDYWRGRLTPAERGAVEARLLTRPGLREVDQVVRTLRAVPRLRAAPHPMWRYAFAGTSLLLAVSTGALLVQNNRLRDELVLRPRLERGPVIAAFTLQGAADRLSGGMPTFTVPPEAGWMRLHLRLEGTAAVRYRAAVLTDAGQEIWSQDRIAPRGGGIEVNLPVLEAGDYELALAASTDRGLQPAPSYTFRVVRR